MKPSLIATVVGAFFVLTAQANADGPPTYQFNPGAGWVTSRTGQPNDTSLSIIISEPPSVLKTVATVMWSGDVFVDWAVIDECLSSSDCDPISKSYSRLLRAARDGTWKPPQPKENRP